MKVIVQNSFMNSGDDTPFEVDSVSDLGRKIKDWHNERLLMPDERDQVWTNIQYVNYENYNFVFAITIQGGNYPLRIERFYVIDQQTRYPIAVYLYKNLISPTYDRDKQLNQSLEDQQNVVRDLRKRLDSITETEWRSDSAQIARDAIDHLQAALVQQRVINQAIKTLNDTAKLPYPEGGGTKPW